MYSNIHSESENDNNIDLKDLVYKFLNNWYFFVIGIVISLTIAFIHVKTRALTYNVKTTILINDEQTGLDPQTMIGFGILDRRTKLQNEIGILKTHSLKQKAINALALDISYYLRKGYIYSELYKSSPFKISYDSTHVQPVNKNIYITFLSSDSISISIDKERVYLYNFFTNKYQGLFDLPDFNENFNLSNIIETDFCKFSIALNKNFKPKKHVNKTFYFTFNDKEAQVKEFSSLGYKPAKESSIVEISHTGHNVQKSVDILNQLTKAFLEKEVEKKNKIAINTIDFIDAYLGQVTDSLYYSEVNLQEYQASKNMVSMDIQVEYLYNNLKNLQSQRAEVLVTKKYYDYLKNNLKDNKNIQDMASPATMNINDAYLNSQITALSNLFNELKELEFNTKKNTPYIEAINDKIENTKKSLIENIENNYDRIKVNLNDIDQRISKQEEKVNQLPKTQRELFAFERKFKLNDATYTYLLQKRSETLIAKAANHPINEVLDPARANQYAIASTSKKSILMVAILIGLFIPGILIYLKYYFNEKVLSDDDIKGQVSNPIIGHIIHNTDDQSAFTFDDPKSEIAESFRTLRTNLQFMVPKDKQNSILVTSGFKGEGKSFISYNLASGFSFYNKKTILLNFDLRKPNHFDNPELNKENGISTYLSNNCGLEEIIQKTHFKNFDIILPGSLPPNPSELIASSRTKELFDSLKKKYDYIIIDTPPIGIISDAFLLIEYSNINLIVVRHNFTRKRPLSDLMLNMTNKKLKHVNIVVNDIVSSKNRYGYGYGYGYGYDYS